MTTMECKQNKLDFTIYLFMFDCLTSSFAFMDVVILVFAKMNEHYFLTYNVDMNFLSRQLYKTL